MLKLHNESFKLMTNIVSIAVVDTLRDAKKRQVSAASGFIRFPRFKKDIHFESSVERDFLLCCRLDPQIINVTDQPFTIKYIQQGSPKPENYTPDFIIEKNFSLPEGQCSIGSSSTRFSLFEIKRERDLKLNRGNTVKKFAAAYKWAEQSADRSFSVMTDTDMHGAFGKYFRLMSGLSIQPLDETCYKIEEMFSAPGPSPNVGQIIDSLKLEGVSQEDAHNAIWKMISKSILQPQQLGDLKSGDFLDYDARHSGG